MKTRGGAGITKKLSSIQRQATIAITGALRSTAADTPEVHAGIPPAQSRLSRICAGAAARIATLAQSHPLHKVAKNKARRLVKRHCTTLHNLVHGSQIQPTCMEKISPVRRPRNFTQIHRTRIFSDKEEALSLDRAIQDTGTRIYTDGPGYKGGIGAAAVLYENGKRKADLRYHLGPASEHTVFEGEIVGVLLGLKLAARSRLARNTTSDISISLDNTAVLAALNDQNAKPSQYLLDWVHDMLESMDDDISERIVLGWIPGHPGSRGNEAADIEARKAAEGDTSPMDTLPACLRLQIPVSLAAKRHSLMSELQRA